MSDRDTWAEAYASASQSYSPGTDIQPHADTWPTVQRGPGRVLVEREQLWELQAIALLADDLLYALDALMRTTGGVATSTQADAPNACVRTWSDLAEGGSDECLYLELLRSHLGRLRGGTPRNDAP